MEVELAKAENTKKAWKRLSRQKGSLGQKVSVYRMLQDLAVRQYALLSKLESLDQALKQKSLSRADYLNERAHIVEQITHVEQLRLWENLADDVASTLEEIADEVADVENAVSRLLPIGLTPNAPWVVWQQASKDPRPTRCCILRSQPDRQ